ncbi:hypothetical protein DAEQUDRAFT_766377 [Daedalea quercina L-15889]|uniref:CCHC-type domain-containing protein n=1 Tax=Daedalea quercina L-15889 TaxID=1314783 RepID=A0A165PM00_9APHY|nr:hypothetical protein DAEQUDRAFT_766377 [Daedalea quercina L-15889]
MVRGAPSPTPEPSPEPIFRPLSPPPLRRPRPTRMDPPHPQRVLRPRVQDCLAAVHRLIREPDHRLEFYNLVGGLIAAERQAHEIRSNLSDLLTEGAQRLCLDLGITPKERRDWDDLVWRITEEYVPPTILEEDTSDESELGDEISMSRSSGSSPTPLHRHPTPGPIRTRPSPICRPPPVFSVPLTHANYCASCPSQSSASSEADEFIEDVAESVQGQPTQPPPFRLTSVLFTLTGPSPPRDTHEFEQWLRAAPTTRPRTPPPNTDGTWREVCHRCQQGGHRILSCPQYHCNLCGVTAPGHRVRECRVTREQNAHREQHHRREVEATLDWPDNGQYNDDFEYQDPEAM